MSAPAAVAAPASASVGAVTDESDLPVLRFVRPMPGFGEHTDFVLVSLADDDEAAPVVYELRAVDAPQVRFVVAVPHAFFSEYHVEIDDDVAADLALTDPADALVLTVVTLGEQPTANLLAPVVINAPRRLAAQVILSGSDWPVRAPLA